MTFLFSLSLSSPSSKPLSLLDKTPSLSSFPLSLSLPTKPKFLSLSLSAAKSQTGPAKKPKTKKPKTNRKNADKVDQFTAETTAYEDEAGYVNTTPLPKPPAGFVVDEYGKVLMVAPKRTATIVDPANNLPLECAIRRVFTSSQGDECMLVCPLDMPILILKSTNIEGWSAVSDDEVDDILPTAAYALAKIQLHLVHSGFCYTARGGFCYSEDDVFDFHSDTGEAVEGLPTEGVEITCFQLDGAHYMIYTPSDPLLFVVVKDENGQFQIADDDLLEDPAIISAIDEETEFNALVEEEEALLESLLGDR